MTPNRLAEAVGLYAAGEITDEQVFPLVRDVFEQGLSRTEICELTTAMMATGKRLDFTPLGKPLVDKHSTGGVGDKVTLILTPLLAACGALVPQVAGRGLGFTGGTIDKLESIPGWNSVLNFEHMTDQLETVGAFIASASADLVPADAKLYALRDVTGTVASIPLIASSIMSKKIAEGTKNLVLDVKFGRGAFMPTREQARELAQTMVLLGEDEGVHTCALLTEMNTPLGYAIGNAVEVSEALDVLNEQGPMDVREITLALAREALDLAGLGNIDPQHILDNGSALRVWREMIMAQGGNPDAPLPVAQHTKNVLAPHDGFVSDIDAHACAQASWSLGAGRSKLGDSIDYAAGIVLRVKVGDAVGAGQPLATLMTNQESRLGDAQRLVSQAVTLSTEQPHPISSSRVVERVTHEGIF